nr:MAG TPA: hypothetical protein [Caudoviricetes sp.]
MTELEILNAALEAAVSEQIKADEISRHYANEVEKLKRMMVEVKKRNEPKPKQVKDVFQAGREAHRALQEMCDKTYGKDKAKISVTLYVPAESFAIPEENDCVFEL